MASSDGTILLIGRKLGEITASERTGWRKSASGQSMVSLE